jgi:hypothetical protein
MSASFDSQFDSQVFDSQGFDSQIFDSQLDSQASSAAMFAGSALGGLPGAARGAVVNRTHRVVRQRAKVIQARRSRVRSLMLPLALCSILIGLTGLAVWTGLYQVEAVGAAEVVQADVSALTGIDANNHIAVVLLWFVPVCLAVLATVLYRRTQDGADGEAGR